MKDTTSFKRECSENALTGFKTIILHGLKYYASFTQTQNILGWREFTTTAMKGYKGDDSQIEKAWNVQARSHPFFQGS